MFTAQKMGLGLQSKGKHFCYVCRSATCDKHIPSWDRSSTDKQTPEQPEDADYIADKSDRAFASVGTAAATNRELQEKSKFNYGMGSLGVIEAAARAQAVIDVEASQRGISLSRRPDARSQVAPMPSTADNTWWTTSEEHESTAGTARSTPVPPVPVAPGSAQPAGLTLMGALLWRNQNSAAAPAAGGGESSLNRFEQNHSKYFPYNVPHQHLRTTTRMKNISALMCQQLASETPDKAAELWENIAKLGDVPNPIRKIAGHAEHKRLAQLASSYADGSLISPPWALPMKSYVMAQLHCKLNIQNLVVLRVLKSGEDQYKTVMKKSLRDQFDENNLLRRINLAKTTEARKEEQMKHGRSMHSALNGNDAFEMMRKGVDLVQQTYPVASFVPLEFNAGELDGYRYCSRAGNATWFKASVNALSGSLNVYCEQKGIGRTCDYLHTFLIACKSDSTFAEIRRKTLTTHPDGQTHTQLWHFFPSLSEQRKMRTAAGT